VRVRRRPLVAASLTLIVAACGGAAAPTPLPATQRPPATGTAAPATAVPTVAATPQPSARPRPASGFFFDSAEVVAYYEQGVGFACEPWAETANRAYLARACRLADATNPPGDQVVTVTVQRDGGLADILASYAHRDRSTVDHAAAMRFFATVIGASFGGDDGEVAAQWLTGHLGVPDASLDLRGLHFGTFLSDLPEDRGSKLFIEVATPAFGDAIH